ncbi:MAG: hypothetical protein P4L53_04780 [Candidatus Obscuribacterales bacterium]|nr:hypothetical protein [Candidatus Obscuribacterales bacterium]
MKQLQVALFLTLTIAGLVFYFFLQWMVLSAVCAVGAAYFIFQQYWDQQKTLDAIYEEATWTDARLRKELIEVHKLAITKLVGADEALVNLVVSLLLDASGRLGDVATNDGILYPACVVSWNTKGLELIAQARKIIDSYTPTGV